MYPLEIVNPCREELTSRGFRSLETAQEVEEVLQHKNKTILMVVNSVCGCAARGARPGVIKSLNNEKKPELLTTVFAGVDTEAVAKARQHFLPYPPSSPSIALFKNGQLVHFIERYQIEGTPDDVLAEHLRQVYNEYC
ncbi:MAG: BrxA/BrxB family bacilliredoxin [Flavobacteriales bacterium]|nr:BrxA/BrxB family bacilliredoxin [Flavobacteriales bacterium]